MYRDLHVSQILHTFNFGIFVAGGQDSRLSRIAEVLRARSASRQFGRRPSSVGVEMAVVVDMIKVKEDWDTE